MLVLDGCVDRRLARRLSTQQREYLQAPFTPTLSEQNTVCGDLGTRAFGEENPILSGVFFSDIIRKVILKKGDQKWIHNTKIYQVDLDFPRREFSVRGL